MGTDTRREAVSGRRTLLAGLAILLAVAAAPLAELVISGQVLYGSPRGAHSAAVVDILTVYDNNPAYMRMRALGLGETDAHGSQLFQKARQTTNTSLARVARDHGVDVITVPGGVEGAEGAVPDLTAEVIEHLPLYCIEGQVLHGRETGAQAVAEVDGQAVLATIPEYQEWQTLDPSNARYHLLLKSWNDLFVRALKTVAREQGLDAIVEKGGVTSRLGPVPDVTSAAIGALRS